MGKLIAKGRRVSVRYVCAPAWVGDIKLNHGERVVGATPMGLIVETTTPFASRIRRARRQP